MMVTGDNNSFVNMTKHTTNFIRNLVEDNLIQTTKDLYLFVIVLKYNIYNFYNIIISTYSKHGITEM